MNTGRRTKEFTYEPVDKTQRDSAVKIRSDPNWK